MIDCSVKPQEFRLLRDLVQRQIGVCLSDAKSGLLEARLRCRLRELGLRSFLGYYHHLVERDEEGAELQHLVDAITTNTTSFFREPVHFELLARELIPAWIRRRSSAYPPRIRVWSAACSTGQEAYSLAAVLRFGLHDLRGFDARILGTDVSQRALRAARAARYPLEAAAEIPRRWRGALARTGHGDAALLTVPEEMRALTVFQPLNLMAEAYPFSGRFDAIFCRNALIYFDAATRRALVGKLVQHLAPGGYLFLGLSEPLAPPPQAVRSLGQSVYQKADRI
jgi:chemotaxis protein methyltransferase CheR